jgi:plasmid maintenance system killer protein
LKIDKAFQRLALLDQADEKLLLSTPAVHYRSLKGTTRCSIDTEARNSKWRITFAWENDEKADVELVLLADAH